MIAMTVRYLLACSGAPEPSWCAAPLHIIVLLSQSARVSVFSRGMAMGTRIKQFMLSIGGQGDLWAPCISDCNDKYGAAARYPEPYTRPRPALACHSSIAFQLYRNSFGANDVAWTQ